MIMIIYIGERTWSEPFVRSVCLFFFLPFPLCKVFFFLYGVRCLYPFWGSPRHCWILDSTPWIPDSMYYTCFCWWNLLSGFQSLVGFCRSKNGFPWFRILQATEPGRKESGFLYMGRYILQQQHLRGTSLREMINMSELDKDEPWILDCGRTTYDTIHVMYASIMRHTHEPNCLLTYYTVLRH